MPCNNCGWEDIERQEGDRWKYFECPSCGHLQGSEYPAQS